MRMVGMKISQCELTAPVWCILIVGTVLGIDVEGHRMAGTNRIEPNAMLETSAGAPAELALHLMLGDKLRWVDGHVQEAVDLLTAPCRGSVAQWRAGLM